jgi:hypothetical protein
MDEQDLLIERLLAEFEDPFLYIQGLRPYVKMGKTDLLGLPYFADLLNRASCLLTIGDSV